MSVGYFHVIFTGWPDTALSGAVTEMVLVLDVLKAEENQPEERVARWRSPHTTMTIRMMKPATARTLETVLTVFSSSEGFGGCGGCASAIRNRGEILGL